ncbi:MAG: magnesium chelatase, partial [Planctomycetota bacterium]
LFNVLEERDVQIRGYPIRLELDVFLTFSANPEDYTNRGRIVTPLKDRIGTVVRTHYPATAQEGIEIARENAWLDRDEGPAGSGVGVVVPPFMQMIIEEVVRLARTSPHVSQASGVSVRTSIANLESAVSNAERRGILTGEERVAVRPCDLQHVIASSRGKVEMTLAEDDASEDKLLRTLIGEAVKNVFDAVADPDSFETIIEQFEGNLSFPADDELSAKEFVANMEAVNGLRDGAENVARAMQMDPDDPQVLAGAGELLLEGLYVHNRLSKFDSDGKSFFKR